MSLRNVFACMVACAALVVAGHMSSCANKCNVATRMASPECRVMDSGAPSKTGAALAVRGADHGASCNSAGALQFTIQCSPPTTGAGTIAAAGDGTATKCTSATNPTLSNYMVLVFPDNTGYSCYNDPTFGPICDCDVALADLNAYQWGGTTFDSSAITGITYTLGSTGGLVCDDTNGCVVAASSGPYCLSTWDGAAGTITGNISKKFSAGNYLACAFIDANNAAGGTGYVVLGEPFAFQPGMTTHAFQQVTLSGSGSFYTMNISFWGDY